MFFITSKILWLIFRPCHVLVWCVLLAIALQLTGRFRAATFFLSMIVLLIVGIGIVPSYYWMARGLEKRYDNVTLPPRVDGILVLGGASENSRRLPAAYMLARRYPNAKVLLSGSSGFGGRSDEAKVARGYLLSLGLEPARIILEERSRNTQENLLFSKALIKPKPEDVWVVMASAYHLPRALAMANDVGWKILPWPAYRLTYDSGPSGWFEVAYNFEFFEDVLHEYIGLWAHNLHLRQSMEKGAPLSRGSASY